MCDGRGDVHNVPLGVISRPLESALNHSKVDSLCDTLKELEARGADAEEVRRVVPPVTILWAQGRNGGNYYFGFGGCHRYNAYKKLGRADIPAIVQSCNANTLRSMGCPVPHDLM
eukprot:TRINITY_DN23709_c0_g1_i1.p2 TRINITY_DN23709_c0_g1~~TRINITY_DN23709_c0_g1_i1.p2  ORF type:complete len:115 (+),score=20.54 TRINITY_DN23709_c0_g1_i1:49-393(+)